MFKKKKWAVCLCSVAVAASTLFCVVNLSGCGKKHKIVTAKILSHMPEKDAAMQGIANKFNEKHKDDGKRVEVQSVGGNADYGSIVATKINGDGDAVTLLSLQGKGELEQYKDVIDPDAIQKFEHIGKLDKRGKDSYSDANGRLMALPIAFENAGILVNKKAADACGVDISAIKDFDSLKAATEKVNAAIRSGATKGTCPNLRRSWSVFLKDPWSLCNHLFHTVLCREFGDENKAFSSNILDFKYADSYRDMIMFQVYNSVPIKAGKSDQKDEKPGLADIKQLLAVDYNRAFDQEFMNGDSVFIQMGDWAIPQLAKVDPKLENYVLLPFFLPGEEKGKYLTMASQAYVVNKKAPAEAKDVAIEFLNFLYSPENLEYVCKELKMTSPYATDEELLKIGCLNPISKESIRRRKEGGNEDYTGQPGFSHGGENLTMRVLAGGLQKWVDAGMESDKFEGLVADPVKAAWKEFSDKKGAAKS